MSSEKTISMINKMGERVCTVSIPDDPTLFIEQSKSVRKKIEFVVIEKLRQISIAADGTSPENAETIQAAEKEVLSLFDGLFGDGVGLIIFHRNRPFSAVKGRFFCSVVLETLVSRIVFEYNNSIK